MEIIFDAPRRIQRRRTKGWRMPLGAIYVGRPTKWGNPISIAATGSFDEAGRAEYIANLTRQQLSDIRRALRGKDLCCWCPIDQPCHADVLLEIANGGQDFAEIEAYGVERWLAELALANPGSER